MSIGTSLFPAAEKPQFLVRIFTPEDTSVSATTKVLAAVERRLLKEAEVQSVAASVGRGNPQVYYNVLQYEGSSNYAEALVSLKAWKGEASRVLLDTLRDDFARIPGAQVVVTEFQNGAGADTPILVRIVGDDMEVLKALAARAETILRGTPGVRDTNNPLRLDGLNLDLSVHAGKAAVLGVPAGAVERTSRLALSGVTVGRYRDDDGDSYPVSVRLPMADRNALQDLGRIYLPTADGGAVRLMEIASPTLASTPTRIDHHNRQRSVAITSQIQSGANIQEVFSAAIGRLQQELRLPPGYRLVYGGDAEASSRAFSGVGAAILIAVAGILMVLVLEFGRFRSALVVAGIIPFGVFGAVAALWLAGMSLSFTAAIGIVALIGIEIKNSILLVDFAEQARREGAELRAAIARAGEARFLPVLLTSVTAIAGLLPLAISGSGLYAPLAVTLIGGLVASTLLSRLATPVFYLILEGDICAPRRSDAVAAGDAA
jgi:multidrug efflux pump subunit AcrB